MTNSTDPVVRTLILYIILNLYEERHSLQIIPD